PVPTSTPPSIAAFTAIPLSINSGQSSTLSFTVTGSPAPTLSINQGVGTVTGTTKLVTPTVTTTYTLTATNSAGSATAQVTLSIIPPLSTPTGGITPAPAAPVVYIPAATTTPATTPTTPTTPSTTTGSSVRLVNQS